MTTPSKDDVLRIAKECGAITGFKHISDLCGDGLLFYPEDLERFAAAMYAAGADGCSTQAAVAMYLAGAEESRAALAAADERNRELETSLSIAVNTGMDALTAERAISDKLEKALEITIVGACAVGVPHDGERKVLQEAVDIARAALAEVAAMRNQEPAAVKTYCGGKPNYVNQEKA